MRGSMQPIATYLCCFHLLDYTVGRNNLIRKLLGERAVGDLPQVTHASSEPQDECLKLRGNGFVLRKYEAYERY